MQRICHITTVHPRNDTRIKLKECKSLAAAGFEVHLVVGDGLGDSVCENIQIHDLGPKPQSRIKRMLVQPMMALKRVLALRPDIVHLHDPELLPVSVKLTQKGMRVIYDAHEDVPRQHLDRHYIPRLIRPAISSIFELYENRAVSKLAGVVAATPYITQRFAEQGLITVNVNNYPLPTELAPNGDNVTRQKRVCYIGAISRKRGLPQVIRALPLVPEARMTLCGNFSQAGLETELRAESGWAQVDYLGHVDRTTVRRIMAESSAGIVTFLPVPNHINAQPNKLFEYMSAELPVIASDFPFWREIIDGTGCGVCVDPESQHQIADSIRMLLDLPREAKQMGHAGRQAVLRKYNWPVEAQKLVDFYMDMT
jgi:glycosyltransferase involved in cell wall biosynthesis